MFMIVYWVIIFTGLRAAVMDWFLIPFARWGGIAKTKGRMRFAEQAWLFLYYTAFWTLGMVCSSHDEYGHALPMLTVIIVHYVQI
jgi:acyl-CoA-dependent ceramide synthase